jgi:hypothetical protein
MPQLLICIRRRFPFSLSLRIDGFLQRVVEGASEAGATFAPSPGTRFVCSVSGHGQESVRRTGPGLLTPCGRAGRATGTALPAFPQYGGVHQVGWALAL